MDNDPAGQDDNGTSPPPQRKRVGKACDRCRNKKSKCDGEQPCARCRDDNELCPYSQRDKAQDKVWPKGTAETMQTQMNLMEGGITTMYRVLLANNLWFGPPVPVQDDGVPLIHYILDGVGVLPEGQEFRPICKRHESIADGILRLKMKEECPGCAMMEANRETDLTNRRGEARSQSNDASIERSFQDALDQAANAAVNGLPNVSPESRFHPYLQMPPSTPYHTPKVEDLSPTIPQSGLESMDEQLSLHLSAGQRMFTGPDFRQVNYRETSALDEGYQSVGHQTSTNFSGMGHLCFDPDTYATYGPPFQGPGQLSGFADNLNQYSATNGQTSSSVPQGYEHLSPSAVANNSAADFPQSNQAGLADPNGYINPRDLHYQSYLGSQNDAPQSFEKQDTLPRPKDSHEAKGKKILRLKGLPYLDLRIPMAALTTKKA